MNRTIAFLILGVILLAMGLIMINQYMNQPGDSAVPQTSPAGVTGAVGNSTLAASASPEEAINQLEKKAASSELASKPVPKPAMPAWASNAQPQTTAPKTDGAPALSPAPATPAPSAPSPLVKPEAPKSDTTSTAAPAAEPTKPQEKKAEQAKPVVEKEKPKPASEKAKPKGPKTVKKISVFTADDTVMVRVEASEEPTYKTMHLKSPDRLVVDLDGQWAIKAPGVPNNKYVGNVRIGKQGDKTRIVIDLKQSPATVRYLKRGEGFDIRLK